MILVNLKLINKKLLLKVKDGNRREYKRIWLNVKKEIQNISSLLILGKL